jgi:hypothetical protein
LALADGKIKMNELALAKGINGCLAKAIKIFIICPLAEANGNEIRDVY